MAQAFETLLVLAEDGQSVQALHFLEVLGANLKGLRTELERSQLKNADARLHADMLTCIEALRWGDLDFYGLVPDGRKRVQAVLRRERAM